MSGPLSGLLQQIPGTPDFFGGRSAPPVLCNSRTPPIWKTEDVENTVFLAPATVRPPQSSSRCWGVCLLHDSQSPPKSRAPGKPCNSQTPQTRKGPATVRPPKNQRPQRSPATMRPPKNGRALQRSGPPKIKGPREALQQSDPPNLQGLKLNN